MLTTHQAQDRLRRGEKVFVKCDCGAVSGAFVAPVQSVQNDNTTTVPLVAGGFLIVNKTRVQGFAATAEELEKET